MRISLEKYEAMKKAMLVVLRSKQLTHTELFGAIEKHLSGKLEGNISWYAETVKLDLEARKIVARTKDNPQKYTIHSMTNPSTKGKKTFATTVNNIREKNAAVHERELMKDVTTTVEDIRQERYGQQGE